MLLEKKEVDRLTSLIGDIRSQCLPPKLAKSALFAFFVENPHLLMVQNFDEHMQLPLSRFQSDVLLRADIQRVDEDDLHIHCDLPHLEFRTASGRWAGLIEIPSFFAYGDRDPAFIFSFTSRKILKQTAGLTFDPDEILSDKYEEELIDLAIILNSDVFSILLDELIADLHTCVRKPRDATSILWSPKLWTPLEQERQKSLIDAAIVPHLERWKTSGVCFDNLNPSEFEDLVGELLFSAGLKIHKVREVPQGGRDLIARGTLIPGEEPIEMAVEMKHRKVVDKPEVELALYQNSAYPALLFVTSGKFTAGVLKLKEREGNRFRLYLKDGLAVGDLVRTHFRLDAATRPTHAATK